MVSFIPRTASWSQYGPQLALSFLLQASCMVPNDQVSSKDTVYVESVEAVRQQQVEARRGSNVFGQSFWKLLGGASNTA